MVPFTYSPDGRVFDICNLYRRLRQPSMPIPAEITAITGIDDAMVKGHVIDPAEVAAFVAPAVLIIAHNAGFDRPFAERFCSTFYTKHWACSMSEIDWSSEGVEGTKLGYIIQSFGLFYEKHRAEQDCMALVELLARPLPSSGASGLSKLLEAARQPIWRIWAQNAPFPMKDILKARGYRWSAGDDGRPKSWFFDATEATRDAEVSFLHQTVYRRAENLRIERLTARERFSGAAA
jgi:DNA polymerase-3 subunit epsilon